MDLKNFLDDKGRVVKWPAKKSMKIEVIQYIGQYFQQGRTYKEKEVNDIINKWHTYGDYFMLRRGLVDYKILARTRNGSAYWKLEEGE